LGELGKLCALQCTDEDIAAFFGVKLRTIERRRQKPAFAAAMESGRAKGRLSVRRSLFTQANNGNTAAAIFLAKNLLGYRDVRSNQHSGPDGGLIAIQSGHRSDAPGVLASVLAREFPMRAIRGEMPGPMLF